ncbi:MAG: HAD-IA family hydrolase [Thiohalocapsa sp.]|nr:HAD-IA family hydrolase [Thiohalocapsa sp.]MCF7991223.1 HAD-IA family hydrolase [Thiohalocapsa sp.]
MKFDLLVFDWDGTLMDSEARIVDSLHAAFADLGVPAPGRAECRDIIGLGMDQAVCALWPQAAADDRARFIERYRHHYLVTNTTPTPLFGGAAEAVAALHAQGYLLAVATGKSRRGLDAALAQSGLGPYFHATRTAEETFSKPHPQMLLELLEEFGMTPGQALMIGDTEYDLQMARNAGVPALGVCYGAHAPERLHALEPLACLSSIDALPDWLRAGVAEDASQVPAAHGAAPAV